MELFKEFLLQALLVLFPVFIYQILMLKKNSRIHVMPKWQIISILCVLSVVLCMVFPVRVIEGGYTFDLRMVPLIISIAYGGMRASIPTVFFIFLLHFTITDHTNIFLTLLISIFVVLLSFLFIRKYKEAHRIIKISYFTALVSITSISKVLVILYLLMKHNMPVDHYVLLFILYPIVSVVTVWTSIHLIENIREKGLMEKEIQYAERLNVIGQLAASVAHEIRNPMTVVRGFMQIFNKDSFVPEDKKAYLDLMIRELDRAEAIINDYLTLAKPKIDRFESIDLGKQIFFVKDIISAYGLLNNVRLAEKIEAGLMIKGSKEKLNQVLINLLKNAIEASSDGGEVVISAYKEKSLVKIDISDCGVGLSSEEIKILGTPFYSTKEKGTGLGLMVCYGIVEAMGGKINISSEKGKGSTFSIQLKCESSA